MCIMIKQNKQKMLRLSDLSSSFAYSSSLLDLGLSYFTPLNSIFGNFHLAAAIYPTKITAPHSLRTSSLYVYTFIDCM